MISDCLVWLYTRLIVLRLVVSFTDWLWFACYFGFWLVVVVSFMPCCSATYGCGVYVLGDIVVVMWLLFGCRGLVLGCIIAHVEFLAGLWFGCVC